MKSMALYARRRRGGAIAMALSAAATAFGAIWLVLILGTLIWNGVGGLSLQVFTANTPPPGSAGGGSAWPSSPATSSVTLTPRSWSIRYASNK